MKFTNTPVAGTVEILASNDFQAIPFKVTEASVVKAGQPMTLAGKKATYSAGSGTTGTTDADGVLLYDVDPTVNPNGALIVQGIIDATKAAAHSGATYTADAIKALKTAVPGIVCRANAGVNE